MLGYIPNACWVKFGKGFPDTQAGRAHLAVALVNKHSGELVELDRGSSSWQLRSVATGSAIDKLPADLISQWRRRDGGGRALTQDVEFGYPGINAHVANLMQQEVASTAMSNGSSPNASAPNWRGQTIRVRVPCCQTVEFEWHRTGTVVSLGGLMRALGQQFTAKQVYSFYRALRVVALKRNKGRKPASFGVAAVGMAASGPQAAHLRAELNKDQLVQ